MTAVAEALDARIDHCPTCDGWRFDGACQVDACRKISGAAALEVASTPLAGLEDFPFPERKAS